MDSEPSAIIELMCEQEEELARLYRTFARLLPGQDAFWLNLSGAEVGHSLQLKDLFRLFTAGHLNWAERPFRAQAVARSIEAIRVQRLDAERGSLSQTRALQLADRFEKSFLDENFFRVFASDDPALAKVFTLLAEDTREHAQVVAQALAECPEE